MIDHKDVAAVCTEAARLIMTDGYTQGGGGWSGIGGWCIEGALAEAMGKQFGQGREVSYLSAKINESPAGKAIREYLGLPQAHCLYNWNDLLLRTDAKRQVLRVLSEVAARHTDQPGLDTTLTELVGKIKEMFKRKSKPLDPSATVIPMPVKSEVVDPQVVEHETLAKSLISA